MVVHGGVVVVAPSTQVVVDIGGGHPWVVGEGGTSSTHGWWGLASLTQWVNHGVVAASLTQVGVVDVDGGRPWGARIVDIAGGVLTWGGGGPRRRCRWW